MNRFSKSRKAKINDLLNSWAPLVLMLLAFLIYSNSLLNQYNLDDNLIIENHVLQSDKGVIEIFKEAYYKDAAGNVYGYRPISILSYYIEFKLFGQNAFISHFINLIIFVFSSYLLFYIVRALKPEYHWSFAAMAVVFFIVHPVHTEVVNSIKNRDELFSAMFLFSAILSAFKYVEGDKLKDGFFSILFYVAAILSKLSAGPGVFVIPILLILFRQPSNKQLGVLTAGFVVCFVSVLPFSVLGHFIFTGIVLFWAPFLVRWLLQTKIRLWSGILQVLVNIVNDFLVFIKFLFRSAITNAVLTPLKVIRFLFGLILRLRHLLISLALVITYVYVANREAYLLVYTLVPALILLLYFSSRFGLVYLFFLTAILSYLFATTGASVGFMLLLVFVGQYLFFKKDAIHDPRIALGILSLFTAIAFLLVPFIGYLIPFITVCCYYMLPKVKQIRIIQRVTAVAVVLGCLMSVYFAKYEMLLLPVMFSLPLFTSKLKKGWTVLFVSGAIMLMGNLMYWSIEENWSDWKYDPLSTKVVQGADFAQKKIEFVSGLFVIKSQSIFWIDPTQVNEPGDTVVRHVLFSETEGLVPIRGRFISYYENPIFFESDLQLKAASLLNVAMMNLRLMVWPYPLLFYYGYAEVPLLDFRDWRPWLSIILHTLLVFLAIFGLKRFKMVSLAILWYFGFSLLYGNLFAPAPGIIAERFLYIASFGFCLLLAFVFYRLFGLFSFFDPSCENPVSPKRQRIGMLILSMVLVVASVGTFSRNFDWKDAETLFTHDIKRLSKSCQANKIYADLLTDKADQAESQDNRIDFLQQTVETYQNVLSNCPDHEYIWFDLGETYQKLGDEHAALDAYINSSRVDSHYASSWFRVAMIYSNRNDIENSAKYFLKAIEKEPATGFVDPHIYLANVYLVNGFHGKAIESVESAIAKGHRNHQLYGTAAMAYSYIDSLDQAIVFMERAYAMSNEPIAAQRLAEFYQIAGNDSMSRKYRKIIGLP